MKKAAKDGLKANDRQDPKVLGGPGSGNFDHAGIPGHQGGSAPGSGGGGEDVDKAKAAPAPSEKVAELMTPEEYIAQSDDVAQMRRLRAEEDGLSLSTPSDKRKAQRAVNAAIRNERARHEQSLYDARREKKPLSATAVDFYGVELPDGYIREGDR